MATALPSPGTRVHVAIGTSTRVGTVAVPTAWSRAQGVVRVALDETPTAFGAEYCATPEQIIEVGRKLGFRTEKQAPTPELECGRLFPGGRVGGSPPRPLTALEQAQVDVLRELAGSLRTTAGERRARAYKSVGARHELLAEAAALDEAAKRADELITKVRSGRRKP